MNEAAVMLMAANPMLASSLHNMMEEMKKMRRSLQKVVPEVKTVIQNVNIRRTSVVLVGPGGPPAARDPITALEGIDRAEGDALYVLKDFHDCWGNVQVKRKLRSVAGRLKFTRKSILVTAATVRRTLQKTVGNPLELWARGLTDPVASHS